MARPRAALFALAALVPAALNAGAASAMMAVPLCTGDGAVRLIAMPLPAGGPGRNDPQQPCCAKGCHTGSSRKREMRAN